MVQLIDPALFIVGAAAALFLFWRAGSHEFIDSRQMFDVAAVAGLGALLGARIFDFLLSWEVYQWDVTRLLFFNAYGGFEPWGVVLGAILASLIFLRKRDKVLLFLDLAAAPAVFFAFVVSLRNFLAALGYLLIFVVLKRLAAKKRHAGFFACLALAAAAVLNLALWPFDFPRLFVTLGFLAFASVVWYMIARRSLRKDIKELLGGGLLAILKLRRAVSSVPEADSVARLVVLAPFFLAKGVLFSAKIVGSEFWRGIIELVDVLGARRIK